MKPGGLKRIFYKHENHQPAIAVKKRVRAFEVLYKHENHQPAIGVKRRVRAFHSMIILGRPTENHRNRRLGLGGGLRLFVL